MPVLSTLLAGDRGPFQPHDGGFLQRPPRGVCEGGQRARRGARARAAPRRAPRARARRAAGAEPPVEIERIILCSCSRLISDACFCVGGAGCGEGILGSGGTGNGRRCGDYQLRWRIQAALRYLCARQQEYRGSSRRGGDEEVLQTAVIWSPAEEARDPLRAIDRRTRAYQQRRCVNVTTVRAGEQQKWCWLSSFYHV